MKTPNFMPGLDEDDMKKIRGFRLRLVTFFFPALVDVLKRTEETKDYYLLKYKAEIELNISLMTELNKLKIELNALNNRRDERLRTHKSKASMTIEHYKNAIITEQDENMKLKKKIKELHKTIAKLKGQNSNKPKNNEVERSIEVSGNER